MREAVSYKHSVLVLYEYKVLWCITSSSCPGSVNRAFFVSLTDHNLTVESLLADTRNEESARQK